MGGYGSGRPGTMATVEDCLTLDLDDLFRKGLVGETFNVHNQRLIWTNVRTGEELSSIQYSFYEIDETEKRMNLNYTNTARDGEKTKVEIPIRLECTYPLYGGKRWWFTCPLSRGGIACGKRVNKLHSRTGCPYFGTCQ